MEVGRRVRWLVAGALASCWVARAGEPEPHARRAPRVLLLAVDGLDWQVMTPLLLRGEMPHLAGLVGAGASGRLESLSFPFPLRVSATLATGKLVAEHGVYSYDPRERLRKRPSDRGAAAPREAPARVLSSDLRRVKALWDVASARRLSCAVVGWNNTWPAEALAGWMIASPPPWAEPPAQPGSAYPPELEQRRASWPALPAVGPLAAWTDERAVQQAPEPLRPALERLERAWEADRGLGAAALCLLEEASPDLFMLQLPGLATVSESFWKFTFPQDLDARVPEAEAEAYGEVLPEYCRFVDGVLGALLQRVDLSETTVLVLSGQGFEGHVKPQQPGLSARPASRGVLVVAGRGARRGAGYLRASVFDVAPTVLRLLELPTAQDMKGRFLAEAFAAELQEASIQPVASYEP